MECSEETRLIEENINLVYYTVRKYFYNNEDYYDLGMIGLIKGVKSYDKNKGAISTYLMKCIKNEIMMRYRRDKNPKDCLSLDYDTENTKLSNLISDNTNIEDEILKKEQCELLYECLNKLTKIEKYIIVHYYGLYNSDKMSQKDIAKDLNMKPTSVTKIHLRVLKKLKKLIEERYKC